MVDMAQLPENMTQISIFDLVALLLVVRSADLFLDNPTKKSLGVDADMMERVDRLTVAANAFMDKALERG